MAASTAISVDEASKLVAAALPAKTRHLSHFGVDQYQDPSFPEFYFFMATWAGLPNGSAVIGNYAVDPATGDVWSAVQCVEETSATLRKRQAALRSLVGLDASEYKKIKKKGPLCE